MRWFNDIILFLHFIGLLMGAAPGIANMVIMRQAAKATPEGAAALRSLPPILANISGLGLLILWITGIILIFTVYGGVAALPTMFWIKIVFVVILTVIVVAIHMTIREIRKTGNLALAGRLQKLGPFAGISALFAILFAVFSFH